MALSFPEASACFGLMRHIDTHSNGLEYYKVKRTSFVAATEDEHFWQS